MEHRIGVARPKEEVWAVLCDVATWPQWNPMYPEISGRFLVSAPLSLGEKVGERLSHRARMPHTTNSCIRREEVPTRR